MGRSTLAATSGKCPFIHVPPHSSGTTTKPFYRGGNRFRPARAEAEKEDHWLKGSPWTFLTSKSHRHSIKNHAASTVTEVGSPLQGPTGLSWSLDHAWKNQQRSWEEVTRAKGKKTWPGEKKKRARETERTFCDCNSQRSRERCKGPWGQGDRTQALQRVKYHTRPSSFSSAPRTPGAMVRSEL